MNGLVDVKIPESVFGLTSVTKNLASESLELSRSASELLTVTTSDLQCRIASPILHSADPRSHC